MGTEGSTLKVLMFPWLAHGHISPYLTVSKKLADRGWYVYLCSTPVNLNFIKKRILQNYSLSIQLVELHLPELPELPPSYHTTNGLPPHLNATLKRAAKMSKPEFSRILENLKPDLLIHDVVQPWAKGVANSHNIPAIPLITFGAAVISYFIHQMKKPGIDFRYPAIYLRKIEQQRLQEMMKNVAKDKDPDDDEDPFAEDPTRIILLMSSSATEAKYIDYLTELTQSKYVSVGPPVQEPMNEDDGDMDLIDWLGKKDEHSTVYVSFGSEYFLTKEDMEEIAYGLELSNINFIWVVRFPKGEEVKLEEALPQGFLERIENRGRVVSGWAPQPRILSHPSTGGFVSHCGWNSVMESIDFGVPIIPMPMHLDQPFNARLMVELGVAVEIDRDAEGKVHREEVAQVIKSVICKETGKNLREKVKDISENLKSMRQEEMDVVVEELIQLCKNSTCINSSS
ncbi:beta-D-glucosyl crocetin beta-1,6-glucosyltransferase-like [Lycium barbarum]|uniref:Glycosyltransferase n=1 Tax=Lycium barbarum TaxID=112863 RepID=B6EWZ0_LYCBA|nr:beta-D-glucosyl crocetin beta-1,6-glucosyltransferase-like [Lycium barbarum]BAG80553.1 UDP-glucose:glucosyltransferase [Lycium barbarum]